MKTIKRKCLDCGAEIIVTVKKGGAYSGGHYFGKLPSEMTKNKKEMEHWECDDCYNKADGS